MTEADRLRRKLDGLLDGELAHLRGTVVLDAGDRRTVPCAELTRPASLEEILERFAARHPGGDPRAAASLWSQWYFGALIPPAVAAVVLGGRALPLALEEAVMILDETEARPSGFRLPGEGRPLRDGTVFEHFEPLVRRHLAPFVEGFARETGLAEATLWCNAGRPLLWTLEVIEDRDGGPGPSAAEVRRALLSSEAWGDGGANPLVGTVEYVGEAGGGTARRRVCCLRYLLPEVEGCGSLCPLPEVREGATDAG